MTTMNRRDYLRTTAAAGALAWLYSFPFSRKALGKPARKPNVVFIIADDMGWNDVGYHNSAIQTPNIDRLAQTGVRLSNHYATPTCTPTRMGIFTGRYPSRFGVTGPDYGQLIPDNTLTLADAFASCGYHTAITGKWHMGSPPEWTPRRYGFESSYGYFHGQIDPYTHHYKNGEASWHRNDKLVDEEGHATDLITDEAVRVISEERDKPFFLYVAYSVPHFPLDEPDEWTSEYKDVKNRSRRWFEASLTHMDAGIGRIIEALDHKGIRDDTVVIFISDNGGQKSWHSDTQYHGRYADKPHDQLGDNTPLRGWKGEVYEGGIRVPALIHWNGNLEPGESVVPMHVVDWMPLLGAIAGFEEQSGMNWDGMNLWPYFLEGKENCPERTFYWYTGKMTAFRKGDWKLVHTSEGGPDELYNLKEDPNEQNNLAATQPLRVTELQTLLTEVQKADRPKIGETK